MKDVISNQIISSLFEINNMQYFIYNWTQPQLNCEIGKRYKVQEVEDLRTLKQNAALFWWYYPQVVDAFARKWKILTVEHIHFFFKTKLLRKRKKCVVTGRYKFEDWSTTKLSTKAFGKYIEDIKEWTHDTLDFILQDPINNEELEYYENMM